MYSSWVIPFTSWAFKLRFSKNCRSISERNLELFFLVIQVHLSMYLQIRLAMICDWQYWESCWEIATQKAKVMLQWKGNWNSRRHCVYSWSDCIEDPIYRMNTEKTRLAKYYYSSAELLLLCWVGEIDFTRHKAITLSRRKCSQL